MRPSTAGRETDLGRSGTRQPGRDRHQQEADPSGGRNVEGTVGGRAAAAKIVVVHARQIVMDQGVGVYRLDRSGDAGDGGRRAAGGAIGGHE